MRLAAWLVVAVLLAGCGGDDGESQQAATTAAAASGGCRVVGQPEGRTQTEKPPPNLLAGGSHPQVVVETSCGAFTVALDPKSAPHAAASFANLAKIGYFDGTSFHRVVPGFVIQGGDPTGTGSGGPGYTTVDKPPAGTRYPRGAVAMAKSAVEPPGTAGSQFFVVTQDAPLPPDYAVIGSVTEGMETVDRIAALGNRATELPRRPVIIDRMSLSNG
jgi:peptidyl-prolyl cis-trans isomerase B (cyclophilin B)